SLYSSSLTPVFYSFFLNLAAPPEIYTLSLHDALPISRFSYAWLIGSVTANLVMLMAFTEPQRAFTIAVDRAADVVIGTVASLLVCGLMPAPEDTGRVEAPGRLSPPPLAFWRRRWEAEFHR